MNNKKLSYAASGVSIKNGNELVRRIKAASQKNNSIANIGGFGALFDLGLNNYKHPVLVSSTDGVGTKIKLAIEYNQHDQIGIDLVAMCVNDVVVQGAKPLFFLDYFACARLNVDIAEIVINSIAKGCHLADCQLIGGETAEMSAIYHQHDYDLAGFCVGVVEKDEIIDGQNVADGDALIAIASSGCHANGYSMIRKLIADEQHDLTQKIATKTLLEHLLSPTKIYVKLILDLIKHFPIKAIAHITGGGLTENIPRVLPDHLAADINTWQLPAIFQWLQDKGNIETEEMYGVFNCGVGMVICVAQRYKQNIISHLNNLDERAWEIGVITIKDPKRNKVNYK